MLRALGGKTAAAIAAAPPAIAVADRKSRVLVLALSLIVFSP
jgi:hypothetical protein